MRWAPVALATLLLSACHQATQGNASLVEATGLETISIVLTHVTEGEPWDTLRITLDADDKVLTERGVYHPPGPDSSPTPPREEYRRRETQSIPAASAAHFRQALAAFRPPLASGRNIRINTLPGCPVVLHGSQAIAMLFQAPDGRVGSFELDISCHHPDAARARAIVARARALLPTSAIAEGFNY
jgi:hypothetical protein